MNLTAVAGTVLAADRSSATTYTLRGGGGFVPAQGGYVAAPQLDSATVESSNLWLRVDGGMDRHFALEDASIPILAGQRVALVVGNTEGAIADVPVGLLNMSSQMWFGLKDSGGLLWVIDRPSKTPSVILTWIALVLVFLLAALIAVWGERTGPWHEPALWTILVAPCFGFFYWMYVRVSFVSRVHKARDRMLAQAKEDSQSFFLAQS